MGNKSCAGTWSLFFCRGRGNIEWGCCGDELEDLNDSAFRLERKAEESEDSDIYFDQENGLALKTAALTGDVCFTTRIQSASNAACQEVKQSDVYQFETKDFFLDSSDRARLDQKMNELYPDTPEKPTSPKESEQKQVRFLLTPESQEPETEATEREETTPEQQDSTPGKLDDETEHDQAEAA